MPKGHALPRVNRTCRQCGKTFSIVGSRALKPNNGIYCGLQCRTEWEMANITPADHFWAKVNKGDGCWEWTAARLSGQFDYGVFGDRRQPGSTILAHRFSYELAFGPIPDSLFVLHHCDNPPCVRPDHLFLGTHADNATDKVAKGRQGHTGVAGERHPMAKVTADQVREMREAAISGRATARELAAEYGLAQGYIPRILNGENWATAEGPLVPKQPLHKLTAPQVQEIRARWNTGVLSMRRLGREYGVSHEIIRRIVRMEAWLHP